MQIDNTEITVTGRLIKTARIEEEWYKDVEDPALLIEQMKNAKGKADIFTFWQRLPETKPKYNYYMEWDPIAAVPVESFEHWYKKQINTNARRCIKKAEKKGIEVRVVDFNDNLVMGITAIFNETPIRQGKPFWHYGKDFRTVKREMSDRLDRAEFIGAYYNSDLIGFIKLLYAGKYATTTQIISKIEHRNKGPNNALVAKAVEICDRKRIPYLVYLGWGRGTLAEFKRRNGFEKINLPRYYIPLTIKGKIALKCNLHHGAAGILPERSKDLLINLRKKWCSRKQTKRT